MTLISGPLSTVTADPTAVSVVQVSVQGPRTVGTGVQTHESKNVAVSGGVFSHEIAPGPATLTMIVGQQPGPPIPILVGDVASQTLAEVVDAARLATGYSAENLAQFVQQVLEARHDVLDAVAGFGQVEEDALTAIGDASAGAIAGIGDAKAGALTAIGVEVDRAEDAADRAENAVNDGLGDGAVTLQKLAPDVTSQINSKADLVGGKVPTSQIPEVALTKPFSAASRAALLALDAQEGDIGIITAGADKGSYMLGTGPSNVFSSWVQLAVSADAPVSSVNGQTGTVVLNAADVGAAPTTHTHTVAQITDLPTITQSNVADAIVQRQTNGNIQVPTSPSVGTDASSKAYVDQKILETGVVVEWAEARTVTITAATTSSFTEGSQAGGTGLIAAWSGTTADKKVAFTKNVVCDKQTTTSTRVFSAAATIPAGTAVQPTATGGTGPYTFTEIGTTLGALLESYAIANHMENIVFEVTKAEGAADRAKASEESAADSASAAATNASNAASSELAAEGFASTASSAATNAAISASNAETAAVTAGQAAVSAESKFDSYTSRVVALEALGGLSAESPVDGQTANLVLQGDSLTRAAISGLFAEDPPGSGLFTIPGGM